MKRFLDLMRYVDCIKDEKIKIQRLLSGLPFSYKDQIQYDEPRNLEEAIRKAKHLYEQSKGRTDFVNHGRIRSKTFRSRGRRGLNHLLFGETHFSQGKESPMIRRPLN